VNGRSVEAAVRADRSERLEGALFDEYCRATGRPLRRTRSLARCSPFGS